MNVTSDGVLRLEWVHFDRAGSALRSVTVRLISSEGVNTDGPNQDEVPLQCNLGAAPDRHGTLQSGGRAEGPTAKPRESRLVLSAMIAWLTGVPRGTGDPSRAMNRSVTRSLARTDERACPVSAPQCWHTTWTERACPVLAQEGGRTDGEAPRVETGAQRADRLAHGCSTWNRRPESGNEPLRHQELGPGRRTWADERACPVSAPSVGTLDRTCVSSVGM